MGIHDQGTDYPEVVGTRNKPSQRDSVDVVADCMLDGGIDDARYGRSRRGLQVRTHWSMDG
jgi:hypothetical protein